MGFLSKFTKETHWKSLKSQNFLIFSRFHFRDIFLRDEKIICFQENIFLTQNLLRNPKITLKNVRNRTYRTIFWQKKKTWMQILFFRGEILISIL